MRWRCCSRIGPGPYGSAGSARRPGCCSPGAWLCWARGHRLAGVGAQPAALDRRLARQIGGARRLAAGHPAAQLDTAAPDQWRAARLADRAQAEEVPGGVRRPSSRSPGRSDGFGGRSGWPASSGRPRSRPPGRYGRRGAVASACVPGKPPSRRSGSRAAETPRGPGATGRPASRGHGPESRDALVPCARARPGRPRGVRLDSLGRARSRPPPLQSDLFARLTSGGRASDTVLVRVRLPVFLGTLNVIAHYPSYLGWRTSRCRPAATRYAPGGDPARDPGRGDGASRERRLDVRRERPNRWRSRRPGLPGRSCPTARASTAWPS